MRAPAKLAAYAVVLAVVTGGGAVVGAAAGPIDGGGTDGGAEHDMAADGGSPDTSAGAGDDAHAGDDAGHADDPTDEATDATAPAATAGDRAVAVDPPGGLAVAQVGYRLDAATTAVPAGQPATYRFRILDGDGAPVTRFDIEHDKPLHLVVVGRDLVGYAHVHPTMADDGGWTVDLPALAPGSYRAFADFAPTGGAPLTLGTDLTVTGATADVELPAPSHHAAVDGYDVTLDGEATAGESELAFTVSRDDQTVRTEPYLGAVGHLVAIRDGDLAYLHVHPLDGEGDEIRFAAEFPSAGTYRLFLDFAHGGEVRTAAFTVEVPERSATGEAPAPADGHDEGH